ncbi:MAG: FAD-linked oxidase C-terminal domain-containing protein [Gemmatimonadales bacterium]|nr:FAD-linked oxidase C-terminal domain-containing protein [Gemmatimonadales bacterium]
MLTAATSVPDALAAIVGERYVRTARAELATFSADGLPTHRRTPGVVVFPGSTAEVCAVLRLLAARGVPFVARGAGTGLSGGALAEAPEVLITLTRLGKIRSIDPANRRAVVEPGVVNATLSRAAAPFDLMYAPDPSSQSACTIGGNVAENAGGPHCLKYGVTTNHVLSLEVALPSGELVRLGSAAGEPWGPDLVGLFVGSEGMFGIATEITVRLVPIPASIRTLLADFTSLRAAGEAVSNIIAAGIVPAALEMMDQSTIQLVESSIYAAGYPTDAAAVLLVEVDGRPGGAEAEATHAEAICRASGARDVRKATTSAERERLWQGRKKAFGAMGRASADLVVQDAVVPRTALPDVLEAIAAIAARHRLRVSNVFHAGDGNLHPNLTFDASDPDELARVEAASGEIMKVCVTAGGSITGEHGVGIDKLRYMPLVFGPDELGLMAAARRAFDPEARANRGKVIPTAQCREWRPWSDS